MEPEPGDIWAEVRSWTTPDLAQPTGRNTAKAPSAPATQNRATRQPVAAQSALPPAPATSEEAGVFRRVITNASRRSNIRASPDLGAPVARSAAPSTTLKVFGEAPGDWFQVGDD
jgi:hypothetical protein